ncbi:sugar phosphate nucleotidyltransferase [Paenibacillus alvei]|uniref:mannose-1-phosphate guanylyltransferase n=1 Tax=Paenibacillus alvei TaxID=44250 RepID=UPI000288BC76|nr:sugar phosphate nucleotidyltransferase [Paenibacillus alvei]EJW16602.1 alginate biosynthesis protein AlgA [Paenibacillus alvei DSM 29]MCY7484827.1 NTP transferase domain-containing protein [Paenibacillus alvei]MCY9541663.1 sugar phosphate nucleotidyltransferase [Paenibacillus alvei]MCY9704149.1 sugar phosphate nucleotidyltransferase [Paenibacillus alvei]MCY9736876.1 sugar phosphate nucleotidyltransferase [Paenibacillus alvei]
MIVITVFFQEVFHIATVKAVILAGGTGTRFWPFSRADYPKQFLPILHQQSMIADTLQRMLEYMPLEHIYIVSLEEYIPIIRRQLPDFPLKNIIVEPMARDTAACIGLSALHMIAADEDPVLITLPSDHYISDTDAFHEALRSAVYRAEQEQCVVTLGVKPTRPETGYGYIRIQQNAESIGHSGSAGGIGNIGSSAATKSAIITPVEKFIEKPDLNIATNIFADGCHYWNTGTFIWRASTIMNLIHLHLPELYRALLDMKDMLNDQENGQQQLRTAYSSLKKQSIDYGVIEKCESIYMIPVHYGWDDLGNWNALERIHQFDAHLNIVHGLHEGIDTERCIIYGATEQLIATVGIEDLVVVATDDVVLVCPKERTQDIKKMVEHLKLRGYSTFL